MHGCKFPLQGFTQAALCDPTGRKREQLVPDPRPKTTVRHVWTCDHAQTDMVSTTGVGRVDISLRHLSRALCPLPHLLSSITFHLWLCTFSFPFHTPVCIRLSWEVCGRRRRYRTWATEEASYRTVRKDSGSRTDKDRVRSRDPGSDLKRQISAFIRPRQVHPSTSTLFFLSPFLVAKMIKSGLFSSLGTKKLGKGSELVAWHWECHWQSTPWSGCPLP